MDNSDEPEDLLDGKIVFQKNKDRTFSKTKQYPPNHRNAKHVLLGEGRSSGMRQTRLTRRTHCAKEAPDLWCHCGRRRRRRRGEDWKLIEGQHTAQLPFCPKVKEEKTQATSSALDPGHMGVTLWRP
ncbi:unnamed protein product [Pleuronectes platessa]|uniref:Uncharacterized protein n=1 Tax=Pleuronectes platessa TaxID=8262 RepID=A0A9N7YMW7_PLEPL|nr:unnamed protein product [Pleuronectes platessa]